MTAIAGEAQRDEALEVEALKNADMNVLRMALYQLTGDQRLAAMKVVKKPIWGGVLNSDELANEDHNTVRQIAQDYLTSPAVRLGAPPGLADATELMRMFAAEDLSPNEARFGYEELAFDEFPRDVTWTRKPSDEILRKFHVTIVGCGISGIAAAVQLNRLGIPYTIIERRDGIGGTWWINDYPDARVDITSYLYQFKFEKQYPWGSFFAPRDATLAYLEHVAKKHGITDHVRLRTEVTDAAWDEKEAVWLVKVRSDNGNVETLRSNVVLNATGVFATPKLPDIKGIESFRNAIFHSTSWDKTFQYADKRVAVIGNGSTGTQLMPKLAESAKSLTQFQRTAQWVLPVNNYKGEVPQWTQYLMERIPYYWNWYCYSQFQTASKMQGLTVYDREWQAKGGRINERNDKLREFLKEYIRAKTGGDNELYQNLLPTFAPLGRRAVIDNGWYDALMRDNVELVTQPIERFTTDGIVTADGVERKFDLVVLAAGFQVSKFLWPINYVGRQGTTLESLWQKDGARSYLGMMLPKYPNFFMFYGPNSQARGGGFYSWAEVWARFALNLIVQMVEKGANSVEVTTTAFEEYNAAMDAESKNLIRGEEAKGSYYLNEYGRLSVNTPWLSEDYHAMLAEPRMDAFVFRS